MHIIENCIQRALQHHGQRVRLLRVQGAAEAGRQAREGRGQVPGKHRTSASVLDA